MPNIPFDTLEAADNRSRELWEHILGGPKQPANVTEYLYGRTVSEEGDVTLDIPARDAYLDTLLREDQMTAEEIAALVDLYPDWSAESMAYVTGDIVAYDGTLYRIVQEHTSQPSWTPDVTPALWEPCAPEGVIPIWVAPSGAHDAYQLGDKVTHNGQIWQSTVANNVWEPGVFGWEVVE